MKTARSITKIVVLIVAFTVVVLFLFPYILGFADHDFFANKKLQTALENSVSLKIAIKRGMAASIDSSILPENNEEFQELDWNHGGADLKILVLPYIHETATVATIAKAIDVESEPWFFRRACACHGDVLLLFEGNNFSRRVVLKHGKRIKWNGWHSEHDLTNKSRTELGLFLKQVGVPDEFLE